MCKQCKHVRIGLFLGAPSTNGSFSIEPFVNNHFRLATEVTAHSKYGNCLVLGIHWAIR